MIQKLQFLIVSLLMTQEIFPQTVEEVQALYGDQPITPEEAEVVLKSSGMQSVNFARQVIEPAKTDLIQEIRLTLQKPEVKADRRSFYYKLLSYLFDAGQDPLELPFTLMTFAHYQEATGEDPFVGFTGQILMAYDWSDQIANVIRQAQNAAEEAFVEA